MLTTLLPRPLALYIVRTLAQVSEAMSWLQEDDIPKFELLQMAQHTFGEYFSAHYIDVYTARDAFSLIKCRVCGPVVGHHFRAQWKPGINSQGPIGLGLLFCVGLVSLDTYPWIHPICGKTLPK